MNTLFDTLQKLLNNDRRVALATIISHQGSTPRTAGSRMIVLEDQSIHGTVGGGLVEARIIETAAALIPENACMVQDFILDQNLKSSLDMVCGGSLKVLIEVVPPDALPIYQAMKDAVENGHPCLKITELTPSETRDRFFSRTCLITPSGTVTGPDLTPDFLSGGTLQPYFTRTSPEIIRLGDRQLVIDPVAPEALLFLFGAGHVSQSVAWIAARTGFECVVLDDRAEFANQDRFPDARRIHVVDDFSRAFAPLTIPVDSYLVILTRGHLHDQTVLENAIKTQARYIGMIGSRRKRDQIYANLLNKGVSETELARVHSPIGLEIAAETPEEIAVSIVAELIQVRRGQAT